MMTSIRRSNFLKISSDAKNGEQANNQQHYGAVNNLSRCREDEVATSCAALHTNCVYLNNTSKLILQLQEDNRHLTRPGATSPPEPESSQHSSCVWHFISFSIILWSCIPALGHAGDMLSSHTGGRGLVDQIPLLSLIPAQQLRTKKPEQVENLSSFQRETL